MVQRANLFSPPPWASALGLPGQRRNQGFNPGPLSRGDRAASRKEETMGNTFGTDILIQVEDPKEAAAFYVRELGFTITKETPNMISLHGDHINFFIERGPALGPVMEVTVSNVPETKARLMRKGCEVLKDEPDVPRVYLRDRFGLVYNLTQ